MRSLMTRRPLDTVINCVSSQHFEKWPLFEADLLCGTGHTNIMLYIRLRALPTFPVPVRAHCFATQVSWIRAHLSHLNLRFT